MMLYCRLRAGVVLALVLCPKVGRLRNVPGGKLRTSDVLTPAPVRCEGPTCTDHANALPYGIQLGHTMRNGSPSQHGSTSVSISIAKENVYACCFGSGYAAPQYHLHKHQTDHQWRQNPSETTHERFQSVGGRSLSLSTSGSSRSYESLSRQQGVLHSTPVAGAGKAFESHVTDAVTLLCLTISLTAAPAQYIGPLSTTRCQHCEVFASLAHDINTRPVPTRRGCR